MAQKVQARLVRKTPLTDEIGVFTFAAVDGSPFSCCEAGAHVSVHLNEDLVRSYSPTEWASDGAELSVAVKLETTGRGGSIAMHALQVGDIVDLTAPRNNFAIRSNGKPIILIAGGIGITPIYAMARTLSESGVVFDLHYMTRSHGAAAFDDALRALHLGDRYHLHCDDVDGLPDFDRIVQTYSKDAHYYVCGPEVMLAAVLAASERAGRGTIFFERFAAVEEADTAERTAFNVALDSTGEEFEIPAEKSILQVLREAGRDVDYACAEGTCGTCITEVLEGEIDHRDSILTDEEKAAGDCMFICVSRARSGRLVLDM